MYTHGNQSLLLQALAPPSSFPQNNATPLHLAAKYGHTELVRYLCLSGCDINAVTENGVTVDKIAAKSSHGDLASLLRHLREVSVSFLFCQMIDTV